MWHFRYTIPISFPLIYIIFFHPQHPNRVKNGADDKVNWKKQIQKLHKDGKKAAKAKANEPKGNW